MIIDTLTKTIEIVLGEATATTECDVTASWGEHAVDIFLPGGAGMTTNGVTPVTVVDAPVAAVTQRLVQEITLHNNDTIDHTVTLQLNDGGTIRIFRTGMVPSGGDFAYAPNMAGSSTAGGASALLMESGPGTKISALPVASFPATPYAELVVLVQGGVTSQLTFADLINAIMQMGDGVTPLNAPAGSATAGGPIELYAGAGDDTGNGGSVWLIAGPSGTGVFGDGGAMTVSAGFAQSTDGNGGLLVLSAGDGAGTANGGSVELFSGANSSGTGSSGSADVYSRDGASSGGVSFGTGNALSGSSGPTEFYTGPATGGNSGNINFTVGDSDNTAGQMRFVTGNSSSGDGGDILITFGTGAGRDGLLFLVNPPTVDPAITGALWVDPVTHVVKRSP